jgi:pimeloyl-ACP methyl ester carboxylesterase
LKSSLSGAVCQSSKRSAQVPAGIPIEPSAAAHQTDGKTWAYLSVGVGSETILLLHGMAGAYDIWWQVIEALRDRFKIISVTYPPVDSIEGLRRGILAILEKEAVSTCHVVGSSLGGDVTQYLVHKNPEIIVFFSIS